jgi:hypothetical protein
VLVGALVASIGSADAARYSVDRSVDERSVAPAAATMAAVRVGTPRYLTVTATGDILTENAVLAAGQRFAVGTGARYRFDPLLEPLAPWLQGADLSICHMELPIGRPGAFAGVYGRSPFGGNLLLAPHEIARGLADAGFDRCTTASNHSNDLGVDGINTTLDAFDEVGISHAGTARTEAESRIRLFTAKGIRIAHMSYTTYSNTVRPGEPWRLDYITSPDAVVADVAEARARGAELVFVSLHVSKEMRRDPWPADRTLVEEIARRSDVDLVLMHGPHVVQPVEMVNGTWVYWSLGNLLSGMGMPGATRYGPPTLDGLLAWVSFTEVRPGRFEVERHNLLLCTEIFGRVVHPGLVAIEDPTLSPSLRAELQACIDRERPVVSPLS